MTAETTPTCNHYFDEGECIHCYESASSLLDQAERQLAAALDRNREQEQLFGNLLAVLHRDGGHYLTKHGWEKAAEDAEAEWYARQLQLETAREQLATAEGKVAEYAEAVRLLFATAHIYEGDWHFEEHWVSVLKQLALTPPTGASLKELREEVVDKNIVLRKIHYIADTLSRNDSGFRQIVVLAAAALAGTTQEGEDRDEEFARLGREQYGTGFESDEPKDYCETCGGRGWVGQYVGPGDISEKVGCPDCQPEGE